MRSTVRPSRARRCASPHRNGTGKRAALAAALLTGLVLALSFPPVSLSPLAWVGLVPAGFWLAYEKDGTRRSLRSAFGFGYATGFVFFALALHWIAFLSKTAVTVSWIMYPAWLAAAAYLAVYPALAALAAAFARRSLGLPIAIGWPLFWFAAEWLRGQGELGFPWLHLGYSQANLLPLLQIASIFGVSGVGAFLVLANGLVLWGLAGRDGRFEKKRALRFVPLGLALPVLACLAIAPTIPPLERSGPPVALVQGNVEGRIKWSGRHEARVLGKFLLLSREAIARGARFVVWPETATGTYLRQDLAQRSRLQAFVDSTGVPILTGYPDYRFTSPTEYRSWNAAAVFWPGTGIGPQYAKIHLVPFGERMPFQRMFPALGRLELGQAEWTPGTDPSPLPTPLGPAGVLVCFESIFTDPARAEVLRDARMLVNITNDEWFGRSGALWQHAAMSVFRAVEHRLPVLRAANTGLTFFVDPWGRIVDSGPVFEDYTALGALPVPARPPARPPFTRLGDVVGPAGALAALVLLVLATWARVRGGAR